MAFLEIDGQRHPIPTGELVVGSDPTAGIILTGDAVAPKHLVVQGMPDGQAVVRLPRSGLEVKVNGVPLGPQPTPLLHGDKVEIAGHELRLVDERKSGSTQFVQTRDPSSMAAAATPPSVKPAPTGTTGGRLVSLTDGREYPVAGASLVIGRDASCDVVITNKRVSRRHAEIMATLKGYVVVDSSTNGTLVNGRKIPAQQLLARGDVIQCGEHEFRFYADAARTAPPGAEHRLSNTLHGVPGVAPVGRAPRLSSRPAGVLASLVVRSGDLKGQRFPIKVPNVNIGRAEYNDIVLPDDSVSTQHAKLQRREGIWMVIDLDSTNGTLVDGEKVRGEVPVAPGAYIRFGNISTLFEPTDDTVDAKKGSSTRVLGAVKLPQDKPPGATS
jgi:pSer/pThr/pTyr-binding forkhead associated (FHA) protein